jgi:hypothetical protein
MDPQQEFYNAMSAGYLLVGKDTLVSHSMLTSAATLLRVPTSQPSSSNPTPVLRSVSGDVWRHRIFALS